MKPKKERFIKDVKAEYIKRMKSPAYVKQVKRNVEMFENFNMNFCKGKMSHHEMKHIAHYFAEDIKNPITKPNQVITEKPDVLTDSLSIK